MLKSDMDYSVHEKSNYKSKVHIAFNLIILLSFIVNGYSMYIKGYSLDNFIIQGAVGGTGDGYATNFLKQYIYLWSNIIVDEPITLLTNVIPSIEGNKRFESEYSDMVGYFTPNILDESTLEASSSNGSQNMDLEPPQTVSFLEDVAKPFIDLKDLKNTSYVKNFLTASNASMELAEDMLSEWDFYELEKKPIRLESYVEGPQILIFHTHAREEFIGGITVVDVADALKEELESNYGIEVLHAKDDFYEQSNTGNRPTGGEYERMEPVIQKIIDENPSISMVIDMHRDGVNPNTRLVTNIGDKECAKVMFVTPICRHRNKDGNVVYKDDLPNPYLDTNLAFALQMYIKANEYYPGFARKIFVNEWRMSTHMKPQSLLLEWGADTNTAEEALNSVPFVAKTLSRVLESN